MAGLDDIIKAMSVFAQGQEKFAQGAATLGATMQTQSRLSDINQHYQDRIGSLQAPQAPGEGASKAEIDAYNTQKDLYDTQANDIMREKMFALSGERSALELRLGQAGVEPAKIAAMGQAVGPSMGEMTQMFGIPATTLHAEAFAKRLKEEEFAQQTKIQQMKLEAAKTMYGQKLGKQETDFMDKQAAAFNKVIAPSVQSLSYANELDQLLAAKNPIADQAAKRIAGRAASEVGRMPIQELSLYSGSPAAAAKIKEAASEMTHGTFSDQNRAYLNQMSDIIKKAHTNNIMTQRQRAAQAAVNKAALAGYNIKDVDTAAEMLYPVKTLGAAGGSAAPSPAASQTIQNLIFGE